MVRIHIARNGSVIGVHEEHAVPALVALGEIRRTDHWWREGMKGWERVGATFDAPRPAAPSAAVVAPPSPAAPAARPAKPAGHLRYTCLRCKHRFEEPKVQKEGSLLAELFYWAISPVAGGFYTAGRVLGTKQLCPKCDSEQLNDEPW